jgi:hypothetical protein
VAKLKQLGNAAQEDAPDSPLAETAHGELTITAEAQRDLLIAREDGFGRVDSRSYEELRRAERMIHANLQRLNREDRV